MEYLLHSLILAGIYVMLSQSLNLSAGFGGMISLAHAGFYGVGALCLLTTAQHLAAYCIGSQWMDAVAYIILILFLIAKPLGFSGKRLKKIEI